jgi:hypothetical protein
MKLPTDKKKGAWFLSPILFVIFCTAFTAQAVDPVNYYVKATGGLSTPTCGESWGEACSTIGAALSRVPQADTIHVAAGTYMENIALSGAVILLGGYTVSGELPRMLANSTILDGSTRKASVVYARRSSGMINGFTIMNGQGKNLYGGGIKVVESSLKISNNYINANSAKVGGGIYGRMYNGGKIVSNMIVGNNVSWHGGGIHLTESDVTVANNIIKNNSARAAGGGVYLSANTETNSPFEANTIMGNIAGNSGGGFYIKDFVGNLARNNITGNTTHAAGGGLYLNDYSGTLVNCMVTSNHAKKGGGIFTGSSTGSILLLNDTIAHNTADKFAPGIVSYVNSLAIKNSIIWHNGYDFYGKGGTTSEVTYDTDGYIADIQMVQIPLNIPIVDSDVSDPLYANPDPSINVINEPPLFVSAGDYHLSEASPCKDRVLSGTGPHNDIDGDSRPLGLAFDMGADEIGLPCDDCDQDGYVSIQKGGDDCDDGNPAVNPGAAEICGDGIDNDCVNGDEPCNQPPVCTAAVASPSNVWPPNHRMANITVQGVTDPEGSTVNITVTAITQDESVTDSESGNTSPDGAGIGSGTAQVRAERSGNGDGRIYKISFSADDGEGGVCDGSVTVCVPLDQETLSCVDSRPVEGVPDGEYDSTTSASGSSAKPKKGK